MVKTKQHVLDLIRRNRSAYSHLGVRKVGLFGSFVRGEQNDSSDIDLLVDFFPERKTYRNFLEVAERSEKMFGRKVEIVTPQGLSSYLKPYIDREVEYVQVN